MPLAPQQSERRRSRSAQSDRQAGGRSHSAPEYSDPRPSGRGVFVCRRTPTASTHGTDLSATCAVRRICSSLGPRWSLAQCGWSRCGAAYHTPPACVRAWHGTYYVLSARRVRQCAAVLGCSRCGGEFAPAHRRDWCGRDWCGRTCQVNAHGRRDKDGAVPRGRRRRRQLGSRH